MSESMTTMQEPSEGLEVAILKSESDIEKEAQPEESEEASSPKQPPESESDIEKEAQPEETDEASSSPKQPPEQNPDANSGEDQNIRPARGVGKRPLLTHKDGKMLSEKKLRRLEKNRLSARECRRRKREATENLQREINVLEGENLRLRLQLQIGDEAEENLKREQAKLTEDIDALLKSGAPESEIFSALESFKEKHADYGRDRRSAIEFHLRNIERLLMPTQTTSILMQAIQGGEEGTNHASQKSGTVAGSNAVPTETNQPVAATSGIPSLDASSPNLEPKALFQYLVKFLGVTPEQATALKDSRFVAMEMDDCLAQALKVLAELRERMTQTGEDLEIEFDNVRSILTPTQAAKFLVWVANNGAAVHMLNELWDRVYPAGAPDAEGSDD